MMRWNALLLSLLLPTMAHAFGGSLDGIGEGNDPFGFCLTEALNLVEPHWCDGSGSRTGGGSSGSAGGSTSGGRSSGSSQTGNNGGGDYSSYIDSLLQEKRARSGVSNRNGGMNGLQGSTGADSALVDTDGDNTTNRTETVQGTDPLDSFDPPRRIDRRISLPSAGVDMEGVGTPLKYLWRVREFFGR